LNKECDKKIATVIQSTRRAIFATFFGGGRAAALHSKAEQRSAIID
jgi:hypothetical protein